MGWQRYSEAWPLPATYTLTAAVLHTIACSRFVEVSSKPLFIQFSSRMINSAMSNRNTSPSRDSFIACRFQFSRLKLNFFLNSLTFALYYSWLNSSIFVYWSTRTCENDPKYRTLNTWLFTKKRNPTRSRRRGKIQTSISKRRSLVADFAKRNEDSDEPTVCIVAMTRMNCARAVVAKSFCTLARALIEMQTS